MTSIDPTTGLMLRPEPNDFPVGPSSVDAALRDACSAVGDQKALIDNDRSWTYSELGRAVDRAAGVLVSLGVTNGDRVAWSAPNCAELPIGFFACQRVGAVWVGMHPGLKAAERSSLLEDCGARLFVSDKAPDPSDDRWADIAAFRDRADPIEPTDTFDIDPYAPAAIAYTSGTTGSPKGAVHSQHNLMWQAAATIWSARPDQNERHGSPLSHTILNIMVLGPVVAMARQMPWIVMGSTQSSRFAAGLAEMEITHTLVVPTMIHDLIDDPEVDARSLSNLKSVLIGGSGSPGDLKRRFHANFGLRALASYGLSEAPAGVARESANVPIEDTIIGPAQAPVEIFIADENGEHCQAGEIGEICVAPKSSGPWANSWAPTLGYWGQPSLTRELLRGDVLHTGDLGLLDALGNLSVTGRMTEVILRGGSNIYPAEVEAVLLSHPRVSEASVLGIDDARLGQRVVAAITSPSGIEPDEVARHVAASLSSHKVPDTIIEIGALPRNSMGKVLKSELVALFR